MLGLRLLSPVSVSRISVAVILSPAAKHFSLARHAIDGVGRVELGVVQQVYLKSVQYKYCVLVTLAKLK